MMALLSTVPAIIFGSKIRSVNKLHGITAMRTPTTFLAAAVTFGKMTFWQVYFKMGITQALKLLIFAQFSPQLCKNQYANYH